MADQNDPVRARRLSLLRQVEGELTELFSHANGLPEPKRTEARTFLRDLFTRAAATPARAGAARAPIAPRSGPIKSELRGAAQPKGPPCNRCGGSGVWRGWKASAPCFACNGSGGKRQRVRGARYGSRRA
jgi:hypothetical protein